MPLLVVYLVMLLVVYFPALFVVVHEVLLVDCSWGLGLPFFSCFSHDCQQAFVIRCDMGCLLPVCCCFALDLVVLLVHLVTEVLAVACAREIHLHRVHRIALLVHGITLVHEWGAPVPQVGMGVQTNTAVRHVEMAPHVLLLVI